MNPYVTTDGKRRYSSDLSPALTGRRTRRAALQRRLRPRRCRGHNAGPDDHVRAPEPDRHPGSFTGPAHGRRGLREAVQGREHGADLQHAEEHQRHYNQQLAQLFHNWTTLCTFTPSRAGDYYLQVRTNVTFVAGKAIPNGSNPSLISTGDATAYAASGNINTGAGTNMFAARAVTSAGLEDDVSVSGYDRMPILANKEGAESQFHLIRVLPGGAGQTISFSFFDVADADGAEQKYIQVQPPADAIGSIKTVPFPTPGCQAYYGDPGSSKTALTNCRANVSSAEQQREARDHRDPHSGGLRLRHLDHRWLLVQGARPLRRGWGPRLHHLGRDDRRRPGAADRVATKPAQPRAGGWFSTARIRTAAQCPRRG